MRSRRIYSHRMRAEERLIRSQQIKSAYKTIHIICEGETECAYFRKLSQDLRLSSVIVHKGNGSAPISIVAQAISLAEKEPDIDHIFCVFDKDEHESFERASHCLIGYQLQKANNIIPNIKIFTSIPCFEIWLLLHFAYSTKSYIAIRNKSAADHLLGDLQKHLPEYKKGANVAWYNQLVDKQVIALMNAKRLQRYNLETQSNNPATNIHELIAFLQSSGGSGGG
ncbi:MAG TPA: RloB family protein [Gammaproteobacteria bacterium]|nr:RloB family protein [Gammaproteobacteria bacterium]